MIKTIADIAKIAGVSKSTVSRALNDSPMISIKVKKIIQDIAKSNEFEAHQGARNLSLKKTNIIGLIIPLVSSNKKIISDPFFVELLKGITSAVSEYNYDLLIVQSYGKNASEICRYIKAKKVDGLILIGSKIFLESIFNILEKDAPICYWGDFDDSYCSVDSDNLTGGLLATEYLIKIGRKKITFLGGTKNQPETILRYKGYIKALKKAKIEPNQSYTIYGDYSSNSGYENMNKILKTFPDIDGVFACNDLMAIGAMQALNEQKYNIPKDISIIGFDDIPLAEHSSPSLTTVKQNIITAGECLAHNLITYLKEGKIMNTILPVELIVRKTTL